MPRTFYKKSFANLIRKVNCAFWVYIFSVACNNNVIALKIHFAISILTKLSQKIA